MLLIYALKFLQPVGERIGSIPGRASAGNESLRMIGKSSNEAKAFDLAEHYGHPGFLIRRVHQIATSMFMKSMTGLDITPLQYTILRIVARYPGLTQKVIATKAVLDASTTHDIILRLVAKGFLSRARDAADGRSWMISLTVAGHAALKEAEPVVHATQDELVSNLSPRQREQFLNILAALVQSHSDQDGSDAAPGPWRRGVPKEKL